MRYRIKVMLSVLVGFCAFAVVFTLPLATAQEKKSNSIERQLDQFKQTQVIFSNTFYVDRIYKSMQGPMNFNEVYLGNKQNEELELLWIIAYDAVIVGEDKQKNISQEFMCHSNLDFKPYSHRRTYAPESGNYVHPRIFTVAQGQTYVELPKGFGIPIMSNEPLSLATQVLNLNIQDEQFTMRHKVTITYVRDKDLAFEMKPLYPSSAYGLKSLDAEQGYYGVDQASEETHGPGCLSGLNATEHYYQDQNGRRFTGHWIVKPGREVNHTLATKLMALPYDTTLHYIAVHLHPFAESLELRDITANKTLFKSQAINTDDKIGLKHLDYFSSEEGIPVYKDHEYEIISVYDNTTQEDQDAMAVMYLYLLDKDFHYQEKVQ